MLVSVTWRVILLNYYIDHFLDTWLNAADVTSGTIGCAKEYQTLFLVMKTKTIGFVGVVEEKMSPRHDFSLCDVIIFNIYSLFVLKKRKVDILAKCFAPLNTVF